MDFIKKAKKGLRIKVNFASASVTDATIKKEVTLEEEAKSIAESAIRDARAAMKNAFPTFYADLNQDKESPHATVQQEPSFTSGDKPLEESGAPSTNKIISDQKPDDYSEIPGGTGGGGNDGGGNSGNGDGEDSFNPEPDPRSNQFSSNSSEESIMTKDGKKIVIGFLILAFLVSFASYKIGQGSQQERKQETGQNQGSVKQAQGSTGFMQEANATTVASLDGSGKAFMTVGFPQAEEAKVYFDEEGNTYERHTGGQRVCQFAINGKILERIFVGDASKSHNKQATKLECDILAKRFYAAHKTTTAKTP
jgi:hypothetical protein